MDYEIIEAEEIQIVGVSLKTSLEAAENDIGACWEKFFSEEQYEKIPHKSTGAILAAYTKYEGDHTKPYTYILGAEVDKIDEIPEGMIAHKVKPSYFAHFSIKGEMPEAIVKAWEEIWESDLERTFETDIEIYMPASDDPNLSVAELFIGIKEPNFDELEASEIIEEGDKSDRESDTEED